MQSSSSSIAEYLDGRIVDSWYSIEKGPTIKLHWILRTVEGKIKLTTPCPFKPYCVIPAKYLPHVQEVLERSTISRPHVSRLENAQLTDSDGAPYKLEFLIPKHVGEFRKRMELLGYPEVYIADILFMERVKIEGDITDEIRIHADGTFEKPPPEVETPPYVIWYWDIETSDELEGASPDPKTERILCIAYVTDTGEEDVLASDDEKETLKEFHSRITHNVDILVGYNSEKFDEPYLRKRLEQELGISPRIRGVNFLDLGPLIINAEETTLPSWSLDYIAETKLGEKKIVMTMGFHEAFRTNRKLLIERCIDDARKLYKLERAFRYVTYALENVFLSGCRIDKAKFVSYVGDGLTLRESYHRCTPRVVWRCKHHSAKGEKFSGAIVREPPLGVHKRVACLDFSALYTRIIRESWISRSSLTQDSTKISCGEGIYFDTSLPAPVPQILIRLEQDRNRYLKLLQEADTQALIDRYDMLQKQRKISGNAMYGFTGDARTRYFYHEIASAVTRIAREYLTVSMEFIQGLGFEVIYADTDGIYIKFGEDVTYDHIIYTCNGLVPIINSLCSTLASKRNVPKEKRCIDIKFEAIYSRIIFFRSEKGAVAKKRYAAREVYSYKRGGMLDQPKTDIKGLEERRGDRTELTKIMQVKIIDFLMRDDIHEATRYIKNMRRSFFAAELDDLAVLSSSITKAMDEYKTRPPHFRAAEKAKALGERLLWGKIQYCYIDERNGRPIVEPVIKDKIPKMKPRGRAHFWEKRVLPWVRRVLGAILLEEEIERELEGTAQLSKWFN